MNQDYFESTSKKKKELYIQSQPRVINNYQKTLKEYATILFQSIYKKILDDLNKDEW
jgi:heterodisulfide reductase subunit C